MTLNRLVQCGARLREVEHELAIRLLGRNRRLKPVSKLDGIARFQAFSGSPQGEPLMTGLSLDQIDVDRNIISNLIPRRTYPL